MPGLVPGIHALPTLLILLKNGRDRVAAIASLATSTVREARRYVGSQRQSGNCPLDRSITARDPKLTSLSRDSVTTAGQLQRQGSPGLQLPSAPPRADLETGSPLGGRPPLDTNIRKRLEYRRRAFQAGNRSCAFDGCHQCRSGRRCARGSETGPPKMLRNNLG